MTQMQSQDHDAVELISLPTQLVMRNAPEVRRAIQDRIEAGRHLLILDLEPVEFVDSSGLSVLVSTLKALRPVSGEVVLLSPSDDVRALIELTRLHKVFEIYEDRESAIADMQQRAEVA